MSRPVTILVGALGGDGGGVLCDWIVAAAQARGLAVQATQIPGRLLRAVGERSR